MAGGRTKINNINAGADRRDRNRSRRENSTKAPPRWIHRRTTQTRKISWTTLSNRNAGISRPAIRWNARGFRCPARIVRNEIRKSAWHENSPFLPNLKPEGSIIRPNQLDFAAPFRAS